MNKQILVPLLTALIVNIAYADISGSVFQDFNLNGIDDGLEEPALSNVKVSAYGLDGQAQGNSPQYTDSVGEFRLTGLSGEVRLEFTFDDGREEFLFPVDSERGQLQFADDGDSIEMPFHNPSQTCDQDSVWAVSCYVNGDSQSASSPADALVRYSENGNLKAAIASKQDVGAVWGLAYQAEQNRLFIGSVLKRHSAHGTAGPGVVYSQTAALTVAQTPLPFFQFADHGISVGNIPSTLVRGLQGITASSPNHDAVAFDLVGKADLGGIALDETGLWLYVVNLADRKIYQVDTRNPAAAPQALIDFPGFDSSACNAGIARPWALKQHQGSLYLGIVCSAELNGRASDLTASVYNYKNGVWTEALAPFDLDYPRQDAYPGHNARWQPWGDQITDFISPRANGENFFSAPSPMLSDIEFDSSGNMILGFTDRTSMQMGARNWGTNTANTSATFYTVSGGDVLKAEVLPSGQFRIEAINNASDEFFSGDRFLKPGEDHLESHFGGLAVRHGSGEVAMTGLDPSALDSGGLYWLDTSDGSKTRTLELYRGAGNGFNGKSTGLGDMELMCEAAPLKLGNRVWCDQGSGYNANDNNGIQDPGELSISGVRVQLNCGGDFAEVLTDSDGHYVFDDDAWSSSAQASGARIPRYSQCRLSIDMALPANADAVEASCGTTSVTHTKINGNTGVDRLRDNDGTLIGDLLQVQVDTSRLVSAQGTGRSGQNDFSFDFGFAASNAVTPTRPVGPPHSVPLLSPYMLGLMLSVMWLSVALLSWRAPSALGAHQGASN